MDKPGQFPSTLLPTILLELRLNLTHLTQAVPLDSDNCCSTAQLLTLLLLTLLLLTTVALHAVQPFLFCPPGHEVMWHQLMILHREHVRPHRELMINSVGGG